MDVEFPGTIIAQTTPKTRVLVSCRLFHVLSTAFTTDLCTLTPLSKSAATCCSCVSEYYASHATCRILGTMVFSTQTDVLLRPFW